MAAHTKSSTATKAPAKKTVARKTVMARKSAENAKQFEAKTLDVLELFFRTYSRF